MKEKVMILLIVFLLLIPGCQNKGVIPIESKETENPSQVNEDKSLQVNKTESKLSSGTENVESDNIDISLYDIFPYKQHFTWYYEGALDYGRYETIVNIEETLTDEKAKYIYIEGEVDDLSGGEAGDMSFVKKYKISDQSIDIVLGDTSLTLIKAPLKKGNNWTQDWIDGDYGKFSARITITDLTDTTITTELTPIDGEEGVNKEYKVVTTYEVGKGVVSVKTNYPIENESYEFPIWLSKTSQIAPDRFVSRYIEPAKGLNQFYQHDDMWYKGIVVNYTNWIDNEENSINDEKIVLQYKELLKKLSRKDMKSIYVAKKVGSYYCSHMNQADLIISLFEKFYEETIAKLEYEFIETEVLTYEEVDKIYKYDEKEKNFKIISPYDYDEPVLIAKAIVLFENGVSVSYDEGIAFLCEDSEYVINTFERFASDKMKDYLALKKWQYVNTPLFSDAALTVSWNDLSSRIIKLEEFYKKYSDADEAKWAIKEADLLFELYAVPSGYLDNTRKFWNGVLSDDVKESYEQFMVNYPDSSYNATIEVIYNNLKKNSFMYNLELDQFFKAQGLGSEINESISRPIKEYEMQLVDFKQIVSRTVKNTNNENDKLETITVETTEEFLEAIGSDRKILIKPGTYILPYSFSSEFISVNNGEYTIKNVNNLVIEGQGETPVTILSEAYGYVFCFPQIENISLINLRMGHLNEYCKAGVLKFGGKNVLIDKCILFGCGEWGLTTSGVENMQVTNTLISDCATQAIQLNKSKNITFSNCIFTRNGKNVVLIDGSEDVLFKQIDITNNYKDTYNQCLSIFKINKSTNIKAEECTMKENEAEKFSEGDSSIDVKE